MTAPLNRDKGQELLNGITRFEQTHRPLLGLATAERREAFVAQIISSLRRIDYIKLMARRPIDPSRLNPHSRLFDPFKAASLLGRQGHYDEAVWMAFVGTHFGKHKSDGWRLASNVMGSFGRGPIWTYQRFGSDNSGFQAMLMRNAANLNNAAIAGRFSNHRQYQSKKPDQIFKTLTTFSGFLLEWGGISSYIRSLHKVKGQNPEVIFDVMYRDLSVVFGFGRLGKFDFLTMLGKLELAPVQAGSVYLVGATGPLAGAKLLFFNNAEHKIPALQLEKEVNVLDEYLFVGKQAIEDSICNWQKSPDQYMYFSG